MSTVFLVEEDARQRILAFIQPIAIAVFLDNANEMGMGKVINYQSLDIPKNHTLLVLYK